MKTGRIFLAALSMIAASPIFAAPRHAPSFDPPVAVETIPSKGELDPDGQIVCTYYPDLMIRETSTDSPAPDNGTLIRGDHPPCGAAPGPNPIDLATGGFQLAGRKGPFLIFGAVDPLGAEDFEVISIDQGKILYADSAFTSWLPGASPTPRPSLTLRDDILHLHFMRAVNTDCSVLADGARCWKKIAASGALSRVIARRPPPIEACQQGYHEDNTPMDDLSIISYETEVTLDRRGKIHVIASGPLKCSPLP